MANTPLTILIEALLFATGRPLSHVELCKKLETSPQDLQVALNQLQGRGGGTVVVDDGKEVEMRVAPEASSTIEKLQAQEYSRDIGRAGLEVLSCVLYRGPLSRAEIDFIRGVNSSQTLRTLTMRGLVRKIQNPHDARSLLFEPTTELLAHLGVTHISDLPEYTAVREKIAALESAYRAREETAEIEHTI